MSSILVYGPHVILNSHVLGMSMITSSEADHAAYVRDMDNGVAGFVVVIDYIVPLRQFSCIYSIFET